MFLGTISCRTDEMNQDDASSLIMRRDGEDHDDRTDRLQQLMDLLPTEKELVGLSGQASIWLFDDLKGTWIYGNLTGTVLVAHAFCMLQIANLIRILPDDPALPEEAGSLEHLASVAAAKGIIDIGLQSHLVSLHDLQRMLVAAPLHQHQNLMERHIAESQRVDPTLPLLNDALFALKTAIQCAVASDS
jgi:hypothetical protein